MCAAHNRRGRRFLSRPRGTRADQPPDDTGTFSLLLTIFSDLSLKEIVLVVFPRIKKGFTCCTDERRRTGDFNLAVRSVGADTRLICCGK